MFNLHQRQQHILDALQHHAPFDVDTTIPINQHSQQIYQRNYTEIHLAALQDTYQYTCQLIGEASFRQLSRAYLQQYPSNHGDLNEYGQQFATFLAAELQSHRNMGYIHDVAMLEWQLFQSFCAPDAIPASLKRLLEYPEQQLLHVAIALHPAVCLLYSIYPLVQIWQFLQKPIGTLDLSIHTEGSYLLIYREQHQVNMIEIHPQTFALLKSWHSERTLMYALIQIQTRMPDIDIQQIMQELQALMIFQILDQHPFEKAQTNDPTGRP